MLQILGKSALDVQQPMIDKLLKNKRTADQSTVTQNLQQKMKMQKWHRKLSLITQWVEQIEKNFWG